MTAAKTRPAKASRAGHRAPKRPADAARGLPARDQPCAWCGLENSVYADRLPPWADRCWLCYDGPTLRRVPRDLRLQRATVQRICGRRVARKTFRERLAELEAENTELKRRLAAGDDQPEAEDADPPVASAADAPAVGEDTS